MFASRRRLQGLCFAVACIALLLTACGSGSRYAADRDTHIVRRGETLFSIAWRYGKNPSDVARWNRLGDGSLIHPGQVIRLSPPPGYNSRSSTTARKPPPRSLPKVPTQPPPTWAWPTQGKIDVGFGGKPGTGTGVLINGKAGQAINAAASGRVVYAGSGLIGYGQLIILKHNDTYLSAYGYSASLLVKEGESIKKGQRIATMGEGPERKARLHFEIRRNGKPVNPRQYLPAR
ncbi:MAG: peptidoglycan DD-metalloendopeptidase family protein [Gammaproteobacteria bacterium]|nr:peptidoglycan DD-metalloendopeptidase family protein [Gammaproteobacteria bacterium]MDH3408903.1 peptidoglycan DD-metalloendopeptidase family protein [Gammaproteobacteria bacterium]MDH3551369.1 peptidoglycan DD-metalloendopeptidase family protein [Gammaproteobacteria bacterium]